MKRNKLTMAVVVLLCGSLMFSSCIGSFGLTNKLLGWNKGVGGNKFVSELVFFAFWVLPVYEISLLADVVVLNSGQVLIPSQIILSRSKVKTVMNI